MKTLKKTLSTLIVLSLVFFISGCKKFDEGGLISKADKRLTAQSWTIQNYLRNANDETSTLLVSGYVESYKDGGILTRFFRDKKNDPETQQGTWEFVDDDKVLKIDGIGSVEISAQAGTVSSSRYTILKLTKDEFWYSFVNGGDTHEFHLVPD